MKRILCATMEGFDAKPVDVEVSFVRALPGFTVVGLAQASIQESRERIKAALSASEFKFPPQKVTVNLSPSDLRKEGSHFDLPIALAIALQKSTVDFEGYWAFGELGLDGRLKDTATLFAMLLSLAPQLQGQKVIVPEESVQKLSKIPGLSLYPCNTLKEAIALFDMPREAVASTPSIKAPFIEIDGKRYYYSEEFEEDFSEIKGQKIAKRAALIAAAGMHNILFEGSPGCGKSMTAKRMRAILPPMSLEELLAQAKLDALEGKEPTFAPLRPFRSPHHSATRASIFGGGSRQAKIGETALADGGILFFDELPHFQKSTLESLREPLEDHHVLISRVNAKIEYRTRFLFIGAMNPCPCGNLLSRTKPCRCSDLEINRYKARLSAPLKDRIDLYVQMEEIGAEDRADVTSKELFAQVLRAFKMQKKRAQSTFNGKLPDHEVSRYCRIDTQSEQLVQSAITRYGLSQRGVRTTLRVARTIADLEGSEEISKSHLLEALSYRMRS